MLAQLAVTDTSELARLSLTEFDASNRAFTWLMLKLSLLAVALVCAGLGLLVLV
jgi:hypothetical protein